MIAPRPEAEICTYLHQLPLEQQCHVLEFVRALVAAQVRGVPGHSLLQFAGTFGASDLATMAQAIENERERIYE